MSCPIAIVKSQCDALNSAFFVGGSFVEIASKLRSGEDVASHMSATLPTLNPVSPPIRPIHACE